MQRQTRTRPRLRQRNLRMMTTCSKQNPKTRTSSHWTRRLNVALAPLWRSQCVAQSVRAGSGVAIAAAREGRSGYFSLLLMLRFVSATSRRFTALRNALALASTMSVLAAFPMASRPLLRTFTVASPMASLPTVMLRTE